VTNELSQNDTDVDLYVFRGRNAVKGEKALAWDARTPDVDCNCYTELNVPADDTYRIVIINLGKGVAKKCSVKVEID